MMGFNRREKEDYTPSIQPPPDTCGVRGCNQDTALALMRVTSGKGAMCVPCSDVADFDIVRGQTVITMRSNYQFSGWFTRCDDCLANGIRNKKAKLRRDGEIHPFYS